VQQIDRRPIPQIPPRWQETAARALPFLLAVESATFLLAALTHLSVRLPLGFATIEEPRIVEATVAEGLCCLALGIAAWALFGRASWAREAALIATVFSAAAVVVGIGALRAGRGPRTDLNDIYHPVILVVLLATFALLLLPGVRAALDRTRDYHN